MATLTIVGLGPVGLTTGVAFATQGHRVLGVDIDADRRGAVARGTPPFYEKGLDRALKAALKGKRFSVVAALDEALGPSAFVFLAVGTPPRPDGTMDDAPLREAVKSLALAWTDRKRRTVVVKSTVLPGTTD
ncbi:MAG TPA: UDP-glucose 6-dehydrogenase, partial [Thermoplasmata archaeon]|nr:UDP-glucose 6-dehydrogenase [Thermoplasmata archaeon]